MIEVRNVRKSFRTKKGTVEALKEITFSVSPGAIYGLIGPNGAGKTTALRTIATLLRPDTGSVSVMGFDTVRQARNVRDTISFLTSEMKLSGNLSPRELLLFFGKLNHMEVSSIGRRIDELTEYLDMGEFLDRPVAKLSTGMTQKAAISVSIVHNPKVIVFDEPTAGLDILASKIVADFLRDSKAAQKTVLLSTHIMAAAEKLCDDIGILLEGNLVENGSKEDLLRKHDMESLEDVFYALAEERGMINHG